MTRSPKPSNATACWITTSPSGSRRRSRAEPERNCAMRPSVDRFFRQPHIWLISFIGLIVPGRLRADWRQEWESELQYREAMLADWDRLDWRSKVDLFRRSASAFRDALWLQPRRWEDEMIQDVRYGFRMLAK